VNRRLLVAALLAGCGPAPRPTFAPCPVQDQRCRVDTFLALEAERGQLWDPWTQPPRVVLITVPELQRRTALLDAVIQPAWFNWLDPLRSLGLLMPGVTVSDADQRWEAVNTSAMYWPPGKEVSIIDRAQPLDDAPSAATLAHEYTHAAQDREFGLRFGEGRITTDREMVRQSLVEGEAELYEQLARLRMAGADPDTFDWSEHFHGWLRSVREQTPLVDAPHTHVRRSLPHPAGGLLMAQAWQRGGPTAVNRILLAPPVTFVAIMLALDGRPAPAPPTRLCSRQSLPAGRVAFLDTDRLGAALFYAYLARTFGGETDAWQAALTWRNDQIWSLLDATSGAPITFWRIQTSGLRDTPLGTMLAARVDPPALIGDDVLFWSGIDRPEAESLGLATACTP
jgi:hypothetical protein